MVPAIETVPEFLVGWLALRSRDPAIGAVAAELMAPVSALLGPAGEPGRAVARRFLDRLGPRLAGLIALGRRLGPDAPSGSPRDAWRRAARQLDAGWRADDPDAWWPALLELTDQGNGLARAVVSGCLADAVDGARCPKAVLAALHRLRGHDGAPYRHLSVPPAPDAPWDDDYLIPPADDAALAPLRTALAPLATDADAIAPSLSPEAMERAETVRAWQAQVEAFSAGWPVSRSGLVRILYALRDRGPGLPAAAAAALDAALADWGQAAGPPGPAPAPCPDPAPGPSADPLPRLIDHLLAAETPAARAFGLRLHEAATSEGPQRSRKLLGCLIYLDELAEGVGPARAWPRHARELLREAVRCLPDCEVLDRELVGRPILQVTDAAITVGLDDRAPPGAPNTVTRVERPGYAVRLPDGRRQVLVKARVRIGP